MTDSPNSTESAREQLDRAVRDLWSVLQESGEEYVVFMDHRRSPTRVERTEDSAYRVSWRSENGQWIEYEHRFLDPREAAFHGFQGPH